MDDPGLVEAVDRLGEGVIVTVADAVDLRLLHLFIQRLRRAADPSGRAISMASFFAEVRIAGIAN